MRAWCVRGPVLARVFFGGPPPDWDRHLLGAELRCFANVGRAMAECRGLVRYMGSAATADGMTSVAHAWLLDELGEVVDVTPGWPGWGARYIGAPAADVLA